MLPPWLVGLVVLLLCWPGSLLQADSPRPNIVLIMSDDMGFSDIGCYGGEILTPNLDRLAAHGVRFTQFYNNGRCCPTRASLLTGRYSHQVGIGHMLGDYGLPAYRGDLDRDDKTIAEVLKPLGYRTYLSGKWHVARHRGPSGPKYNWPRQRGFDRFYGTIKGGGSFYDPTSLCRGNQFITPENDASYRPKTFYYTDAISDNAVKFLQDHDRDHGDQPFFLYVAYTAAHWPMHALDRDIEKYSGLYEQGFEVTRTARINRLKKLGLWEESAPLPPLPKPWSEVKHQEWESALMEVYAAMIDNMYQGIGRIVDQLQRQSCFENTLIIYLQDNGGCAENMGRGDKVAQAWKLDGLKPFAPDELQPHIWPPMQTRDGRSVRGGPQVMPGPADTYIGYGRGWATRTCRAAQSMEPIPLAAN